MKLKIDSFIGNEDKKIKIVNWLNSFFHEPSAEIKSYVLIYGISGVGKTHIAKLLSNSFNADLFTITPIDDNIDDMIKSINIKTLDNKEHKIILVDDLDEFKFNIRKKLYDLPMISNHPVLFTVTNLKTISNDFIDKSLIIKLTKPIPSLLFEHLKTISDLPDDTLLDIAKNSKSTRSAILSTYNGSVNDLTKYTQTTKKLLKDAKERRLENNLEVGQNKILFDNIRGYNKKAMLLRFRIADFDYRLKFKHEKIDRYFVNNMIESIEIINTYYKKKPNDKETLLIKPKEHKVKQPTLDKYF